MADTPANAGPDGAPRSTATSGSPAGSQSPDANLAAVLAENQKLKERFDNAQQLIARQGQELGSLRKRSQAAPEAETYGYEREYAQAGESQDAVAKRLMATDQRLDQIQYRQEHPDWTQFQPDVDQILNDSVRVYEVAAWKPDGFGGVVVDWYSTYRNAHRLVELEKLRATQRPASEQAAQDNEQRDALRTMGTMSGTSAIQQDREITIADIRGKSAKEIAEIARKAGLVPQHDPLKRV